MIDRERVLEELALALEWCSEDDNPRGSVAVKIFAVRKALELLKEQPAKDTNVPSKWISVKDRLPDDASDVLAYYDDGTESRIIPVNYYKGCWYDCIFNRPIDGLETGFIRYWMSLPEPPKEESDD